MYLSTSPALFAVVIGIFAIGLAGVIRAEPPDGPGAPASVETPEPVRAVGEYNLPKRSTLAIKGYDPVAYFPEGGAKATKGREDIELDHKGVTYRFATRANLERFRKDPDRYEPAYGGWCAWAMTSGDKVDIDPRSFIVKNGRLYLFYNGLLNDTRAKWRRRDHDALARAADREWKKRTGEEPRIPAPPSDAQASGDH